MLILTVNISSAVNFQDVWSSCV